MEGVQTVLAVGVGEGQVVASVVDQGVVVASVAMAAGVVSDLQGAAMAGKKEMASGIHVVTISEVQAMVVVAPAVVSIRVKEAVVLEAVVEAVLAAEMPVDRDGSVHGRLVHASKFF